MTFLYEKYIICINVIIFFKQNSDITKFDTIFALGQFFINNLNLKT